MSRPIAATGILNKTRHFEANMGHAALSQIDTNVVSFLRGLHRTN